MENVPDNWRTYMEPEGETMNRHDEAERRRLAAALYRARRGEYPKDHEGWERLSRAVTDPRWESLAERDRRRAKRAYRVKRLAAWGVALGVLSWVVMIALCLYAGHLFAVGIGGAR